MTSSPSATTSKRWPNAMLKALLARDCSGLIRRRAQVVEQAVGPFERDGLSTTLRRANVSF
jgi:hypothetical protein